MENKIVVKARAPQRPGLASGVWLVISGVASLFSVEDIILQGGWSHILHLATVADGKVLVLLGTAIGAAAMHFLGRGRSSRGMGRPYSEYTQVRSDDADFDHYQ
jgi:hypothetical protein